MESVWTETDMKAAQKASGCGMVVLGCCLLRLKAFRAEMAMVVFQLEGQGEIKGGRDER